MSTVPQTAEEVFDSLTGFDELAIAAQFGHTITDLAENQVTMFGRALAFVVLRRDGKTDADAKSAAFDLPMKVLNEEFFATGNDDESGKDEQPEESPGTSLSSVS
jgi:hypothetical protein